MFDNNISNLKNEMIKLSNFYTNKKDIDYNIILNKPVKLNKDIYFLRLSNIPASLKIFLGLE